MNILSVDPGKHAGWCIRGPSGIESHGATKGDSVFLVEYIVDDFSRRQSGAKVVVVEDQQQFAARSYKSTRTLIRRAEIWSVLSERLGMRVERVPVRTWQGHLKLRGTHEQRMDGLKALLRSWPYDVDVMTEDECCACGIDMWAVANVR